ncbi:hypothetical protein Tco_1508144 [Tanacetum coccineum]
MESNKSINRSNEQKNLYKALVEAYKSDKLIPDTYGDTVSFKRRRDDEDKDEEPSSGSNWGSKRSRIGKKPESITTPKEKTSKTTGKSTDRSKSQNKSAGESAYTEEPMHTDKDLEELAYQEFDIGATEEQTDEETSQHPDCHTYATSITKTKAADYGHIKWIEDLVPNTIWSEVPATMTSMHLWGISPGMLISTNISKIHNAISQKRACTDSENQKNSKEAKIKAKQKVKPTVKSIFPWDSLAKDQAQARPQCRSTLDCGLYTKPTHTTSQSVTSKNGQHGPNPCELKCDPTAQIFDPMIKTMSGED